MRLDKSTASILCLLLALLAGAPHVSRAETYSAEQKGWALGTCAVLTQVNKRSHQELGGRKPSESAAKATKALLVTWWSVNSRDELLAALRWIDDGGHRKIFDVIAAIPEEQIAAIKAQSEGKAEMLNQIAVVQDYGSALGKKSLLGWDYARYVSLCGWGVVAGYLTEDEAWGMIMPIAKKLQATFGSWDELAQNYLIGRKFWSLANSEKNGAQYQEAVKWLESAPESPWLKYAWNLNLASAPAAAGSAVTP